jgi:ribosomal protein L17
MKFCPVVPEICCGHIHVPKKERRKIIIKIRNGTKTISLQTLFGRLNNREVQRVGGYYRILWES